MLLRDFNLYLYRKNECRENKKKILGLTGILDFIMTQINI